MPFMLIREVRQGTSAQSLGRRGRRPSHGRWQFGLATPAAGELAAASHPGLMTAGDADVVGMNLQFKPEMYLRTVKPAGYDVDLLHKLAAKLRRQAPDREPRLQRADPGAARRRSSTWCPSASRQPPPASKVVSFTTPYVPYARSSACRPRRATVVDEPRTLNKPGDMITALLGSTDQTEAQTVFPKAKVTASRDQNSRLLAGRDRARAGCRARGLHARAVPEGQPRQAG